MPGVAASEKSGFGLELRVFWVRREWPVSVDWCRGLSDQFLPWLDEDTSPSCRSQPWLEMVLKAVAPTSPAALSPFYCLHRASPSFLEPVPLHCDCPLFILQLDFCSHRTEIQVTARQRPDYIVDLICLCLKNKASKQANKKTLNHLISKNLNLVKI